jgi:hypothetical protein
VQTVRSVHGLGTCLFASNLCLGRSREGATPEGPRRSAARFTSTRSAPADAPPNSVEFMSHRCYLPLMVDHRTLFAESDHEAELRLTGWVMPLLWPAATPDLRPPPSGARCSNCGSQAFWTELSGRRHGWRCCTCVPHHRPDDRVEIIETTGDLVFA